MFVQDRDIRNKIEINDSVKDTDTNLMIFK